MDSAVRLRQRYSQVRGNAEIIRERRGLLHYAVFSGRNYLEEVEQLHASLVRRGLLRPEQPLRVLDIGCGYADALGELLKYSHVPVEVVGTTSISEHRKRAPPGVEVVVLPGQHLPKEWRRPSKQFHLVFSTYGMPYHVCSTSDSPEKHASVIGERVMAVMAPGSRAYLHFQDVPTPAAFSQGSVSKKITHRWLAWLKDHQGNVRGHRVVEVTPESSSDVRDAVAQMLRNRKAALQVN